MLRLVQNKRSLERVGRTEKLIDWELRHKFRSRNRDILYDLISLFLAAGQELI